MDKKKNNNLLINKLYGYSTTTRYSQYTQTNYN